MKMPVGLTVRPKIDLACPLGRHPLQRSVETRPALGLDLARQRIGDVARAARSEFESGEILGAPAQPFAHIAAIADKILAVVRDAAHEDMDVRIVGVPRSEEHTSELQSLMRNSYPVFCLKKKK